eukprot:EG_transcript_10307
MGCMWEGRVWARWALRRWSVPCVLTGISWGGAMASGALALSLAVQRDAPATEPEPPLTLVSHLGCDGPVVLMVGAMRDEIDWAALDADLARVAAGHPEWEGLNSSDVLRRLFEEGDLSRLVPGGAVMEGLLVHTVSAAHDSFVPPVYGRRLEISLAASLGATVAAAWVPGGHASAILLAHFFAVPRIVAAVRRLAAVGPSSLPRRARCSTAALPLATPPCGAPASRRARSAPPSPRCPANLRTTGGLPPPLRCGAPRSIQPGICCRAHGTCSSQHSLQPAAASLFLYCDVAPPTPPSAQQMIAVSSKQALCP